jgi:hypothetical protein
MNRALLKAPAEMESGDDRPGVKPLSRNDIREWAEAEDGGRMLPAGASYFTEWLAHHFHSFVDGSGLQTNKDTLEKALDLWINGAE